MLSSSVIRGGGKCVYVSKPIVITIACRVKSRSNCIPIVIISGRELDAAANLRSLCQLFAEGELSVFAVGVFCLFFVLESSTSFLKKLMSRRTVLRLWCIGCFNIAL